MNNNEKNTNHSIDTSTNHYNNFNRIQPKWRYLTTTVTTDSDSAGRYDLSIYEEGREQTMKYVLNNVKKLEIDMNGQEKCCLGKITINGVEVKNGVKSVELDLIAFSKPNVTIVGHKEHMTKEAKEAWGLV